MIFPANIPLLIKKSILRYKRQLKEYCVKAHYFFVLVSFRGSDHSWYDRQMINNPEIMVNP